MSAKKMAFVVESDAVRYTNDEIHAHYVYRNTIVTKASVDGTQTMKVVPTEMHYDFKTDRRVPGVG